MLACWCPVHAYVSSFCGLTLQYYGTVHDISILFVHAHCTFQARDGFKCTVLQLNWRWFVCLGWLRREAPNAFGGTASYVILLRSTVP